MSDPSRPESERHPAELRSREAKLVSARRENTDVDETAPRVGLALSGGGIRSATFGLGLLRGLARSGVLDRIDYLSTVSGGGYIGSFLGALFARDEISSRKSADASDPPDGVSRSRAVEQLLADPRSWPIRWLRENGRYLSPNGSGDTLLAVGVLLRNWAAVQVVLGLLALAVFTLVTLIRSLLPSPQALGSVQANVWWSPVSALPLGVLVLFLLPCGIAYWIWPERGKLQWGLLAIATLVGVLPFALAEMDGAAATAAQVLVVVPAVLSLPCLGLGEIQARRLGQTRQHKLSLWFKSALVLTAGLSAFALIDSLGQTVYAVLSIKAGLWQWLAPLPAALLAAAAFGQKLAALVGGKDGRVRVPVSVAALAVGLAALAGFLVTVSVASHWMAWAGEAPPAAITRALVEPVDPPPDPCNCEASGTGRDSMARAPLAVGAGLSLWLSILFARTFSFLNQSTLAPLYGARLRRAYLGATNVTRERDQRKQALTDDVPGDEMDLAKYDTWSRGGPLHLVNVTLNETIGGQSQTEQRDRKGLALAFGPAGTSAGVRHHALWCGKPGDWKTGLVPVALPPDRFAVFAVKEGAPLTPEPLSLDRLVSISGAAVSTGLGARTSLGLSLLLGFLNLRLGHWWNSGTEPLARKAASRRSLLRGAEFWFSRAFAVQKHLIDEMLARFPGPASRNWYLSDGGHFENTGCYELIRRRLPLIIVSDCGADPDYGFEDLASLARKVRLDFGASVRLASDAEIGALDPDVRRFFGSTEALRGRRGKAAADGEARWNGAHALLVVVEYDTPPAGPEEAERSLLLWLKPSLLGEEPLDILHYAQQHADFPQEPTGDQYFDEAQWESYQQLGLHVAERLFGGPDFEPPSTGWHPRRLEPLPRA